MYNVDLADKLGLDESSRDKIAKLQLLRRKVNVKIDKLCNANEMCLVKELVGALEQIEYLLQDAWGFPRDKKYHKFWWAINCTCPVSDNMDRYPTGNYIVNSDCPLHGEGK